MNDLSGQIVRSYRLYERLAVGGFGAVYRAYQPVIERDVAIKVILPRYANETEFIRRFEVEAQTVARLEHPHIVPLYDFWRDPDGAYLVMRWLRGGSLRDRIRQGPMKVEQVAHVLEQIGSALDMAHRAGIVHRDLKPENILFDEDENAYLTDFGIAQKEGYADDSVTGSANYIAPEQLRSEPAGAHSDLYSFGILLYEMLTGQHPFQGASVSEVIFKQLREPLPDITRQIAGLTQSVNLVIQRATMKDIELRYETMYDLADAFRRAAGLGGSVAVRRITDRTVENPYKGLRSFEEADSDDFFGREELVGRLLERMYDDTPVANFLAVVGPSGSGKSSVVRAGLIPQLRTGAVTGSEDWFVADMLPGDHPIQNLCMALLRVAPFPLPGLLERLQSEPRALLEAGYSIAGAARARLLLFIDQFEEVFTLGTDEAARRHFLSLIQTAVSDPESPLMVIIAMRADFFDRPLLYGEIGELIQMRTQVVLPLSASELERAITGPAHRAGLELEGELVTAMVADVNHEPGALPLLQYALTELFERRQGNRLTLRAYTESGGVQGALARRAADVFGALVPPEQEIARQIFLRMVTLGEGSEDTRRRVYRTELFGIQAERAVINHVLDVFGQYRLLTFDSDSTTREPTVDIAHEALIRRWDQLHIWLDESRNDIRQQRALGQAAADWSDHNHEAGYLLHGSRLAQFEEWAQQTTVALTEQEQEFLRASIEQREREAHAEAERRAREARLEARSRQLLRGLVAVFAVFGLLAAAMAIFALEQSRLAGAERDNAQDARATSDANALTAQQQLLLAEQRAQEIQNLNLLNEAGRALDSGDSGLAMALELIVAQDPALRPEVQNQLYDVAYRSWLRSRLRGHERKITALALSPDGRWLATSSEDLLVSLWDVASGEKMLDLSGHRGPVTSLDFTPDSSRLVSGATDGTLIVWNVADGALLYTLAGHTGPVTDVAVHPDGVQAVSSSADSSLIVWNLETGRQIQPFRGHQGSVRTLAFSPDGSWIISGGRDAVLLVWDTRTGAITARLQGHTASIESVTVSPDGLRALSGGADGLVILWDIERERSLQTLSGHSEGITSVALSPDGLSAVSTGCAVRDVDRTCLTGEVIVWDLLNGMIDHNLVGHMDTVNASVFAPDGERIYSASCGERRQSACVLGEVLIWDTQKPGDMIQLLQGHSGAVLSAAISANGTLGATGGGTALGGSSASNTRIILWDLQSGASLHQLVGHSGNINRLVFAADHSWLASTAADGTVRFWDTASGEQLDLLESDGSAVDDIAVSSDGQRVLIASENGIALWDRSSGERRVLVADLGRQIAPLAVRYSPTDQLFAAGLNNGAVVIYTPDGSEIRRLIGHTDDVLSVIFSADEQQLVSTSNDGSARIWDVQSGTEIARFEGHSGAVTSGALSQDGAYLLTASTDGTLRYWNTAARQTVRIFAGHTDALFDVSLSADGRLALSASADGSARLWRVSLDALVAWIEQNRYRRSLTALELDAFRLRD